MCVRFFPLCSFLFSFCNHAICIIFVLFCCLLCSSLFLLAYHTRKTRLMEWQSSKWKSKNKKKKIKQQKERKKRIKANHFQETISSSRSFFSLSSSTSYLSSFIVDGFFRPFLFLLGLYVQCMYVFRLHHILSR